MGEVERRTAALQGLTEDGSPRGEDEWNKTLFDESWVRRGPADRLVLMVKDPWTLFAYWTVEEWRKGMVGEHFETEWGGLPFSLRLHQVNDPEYNGENARFTSTADVHPGRDRWYFRGVEPGRRYLAEFGTWTIHGEFFAILRSNVTETPPEPESAGEPSVRFRKMEPVPGGPSGKRGGAFPGSDEPWSESFDGYSLREDGKRGEKQ
ncbi:uncharacterized protein DUF4912 [Melghirimyces profundicolus]|uniref:Uncharacterized protein DUF4912 n=1 Tax=Melghirimyces profundicolus TaxID=1242148 RepID=A0A2T6BH20_9BACL|nr:uncharacterized protein DUF4912 [Melghirimyces profundicolus]